jgi:hypothetical protein
MLPIPLVLRNHEIMKKQGVGIFHVVDGPRNDFSARQSIALT